MNPLSVLGSALSQEQGAPSLQRQLIHRLKQAILSGQLPANGKLPSSRQLAEELHISRNTVLIAYEQLAAEGYVVADRQGTRVTALSEGPLVPQGGAGNKLISPGYADRLARIVPVLPSNREWPLTLGLPALNHFPINVWKKMYDHVLQTRPAAVLSYGDPLGEPDLRQAIAQHLRVSRGVRCDASRIIITEGAQEALSLCVKLLANPGDRAWMEDPGYRGAKNALYSGDLDVMMMRVDQEGMVIPSQAWITHPPRLILTTPSHQYPTGAVLSVSRRLELIERALAHQAWIIEDDYDSEFRHQGEPIAAMQGLLPDTPVLYIGTFSKTMFPALRLGFLILPERLMAPTLSSIKELLRGGHRLEQLAMAAFMENGHFSRHLGRMRRLYRDRQSALREALAAHFTIEHEILGGNSGLHLTVRLPRAYSDQAIVKEARRNGINPSALSTFAVAPLPQDNGLVIGYGNTSAERFAPLIKSLSAIAYKVQQ